MAKISSVEFTGKSGKKYAFNVYPIDEECPAESGIYVFGKREMNNSGNFTNSPVYIGMAQSFDNRMSGHHKLDCAVKHGANCLCLRQIKNEEERKKAERDLLDNYNTKCNEVNN